MYTRVFKRTGGRIRLQLCILTQTVYSLHGVGIGQRDAVACYDLFLVSILSVYAHFGLGAPARRVTKRVRSLRGSRAGVRVHLGVLFGSWTVPRRHLLFSLRTSHTSALQGDWMNAVLQGIYGIRAPMCATRLIRVRD